MGRRVGDGVKRQIFDLLRKYLDVLLKVPDDVVLGTARFGLPIYDLLPQAHHLIAHLLDKLLVLL